MESDQISELSWNYSQKINNIISINKISSFINLHAIRQVWAYRLRAGLRNSLAKQPVIVPLVSLGTFIW
jgi:hypothetical protein